MRSILTTALCGIAAGSAAAGGTPIALFDLTDHPGSLLSPPPYGVRLDNIIGSGNWTFSMDTFSDTTLTVFDNGGNLEIQIAGTVFGGEVQSNAYVGTPEAYELEFNYVMNVSEAFGGYGVWGLDASNVGSITRVSDNASWALETELFGSSNNAFLFAPDGYRLDNDDSTWVGRGWLSDGSGPLDGDRDWSFIGIDREIPAPGALAMLGLGGLVGSRRRR